ncbi:MAG TPA: hypothetical protein VGI39_29660 [Polyangiaceae bacterium]|jgi:hypothetical protein
MNSAEMSKRAHFWLRVAALAVIAAAAWIPRTPAAPKSAMGTMGDGAIQASVTAQ